MAEFWDFSGTIQYFKHSQPEILLCPIVKCRKMFHSTLFKFNSDSQVQVRGGRGCHHKESMFLTVKILHNNTVTTNKQQVNIHAFRCSNAMQSLLSVSMWGGGLWSLTIRRPERWRNYQKLHPGYWRWSVSGSGLGTAVFLFLLSADSDNSSVFIHGSSTRHIALLSIICAAWYHFENQSLVQG